MNRKNIHIFRKRLESILYPTRCIVCDDLTGEEEGLHTKCKNSLYPIQGAVCMHCGRQLVVKRNEYCYDCSRRRDAVTIQGKALYSYSGEIKKTMYRFKYANKREYAYFFAKEAIRCYGKWISNIGIQAIVPVPMYRGKQKKRGYNQAQIFAKELSALTGIPVWEAVKRIRDTAPQKGLDDVARKNNLKNAFQTNGNIVKYRYILLVDDIYTTGYTIESVADVLKKVGVDHIYFLNICIGKGF